MKLAVHGIARYTRHVATNQRRSCCPPRFGLLWVLNGERHSPVGLDVGGKRRAGGRVGDWGGSRRGAALRSSIGVCGLAAGRSTTRMRGSDDTTRSLLSDEAVCYCLDVDGSVAEGLIENFGGLGAFDGPSATQNGKWNAFDSLENRVTDEAAHFVLELVGFEERTGLLGCHQAGTFGSLAEKVVAANVGLLLEKGGKEGVHHLDLGSFTTTEPCLEGETMGVGGLTSLSGEFEINTNALSAFFEHFADGLHLLLAKFRLVAGDSAHWFLCGGWKGRVEFEWSVLHGKEGVWMGLAGSGECYLQLFVGYIAPGAIKVGNHDDADGRRGSAISRVDSGDVGSHRVWNFLDIFYVAFYGEAGCYLVEE